MRRRKRRSKLEMHIELLKTLYEKGPLKLTHIMRKANINYETTKLLLASLCEKNLVEEKISNLKTEKSLFCITENGKRASTYFIKLNSALQPTIKENNFQLLYKLF